MRRTWVRRAAAVGLAGVCLGLSAFRQPEPPPAHQPPPADANTANSPADRAALRERLQRRLEEARRVEERIQAAINRLDGGESVATVQNDVEGNRRRGSGRFGHERGDKSAGDDRPRLDQAAVLRAVNEYNPAMAEHLTKVLKENPTIGARIMGRLEPQVREIEGESDAETKRLRIAELNNEFETLGAMRAFGEALRADQPTGEAEATLRRLIGGHFDLQVQLRKREIAKLETRLAALRTQVEGGTPQRESFINDRMERIRRGAARFGKDGRDAPAKDAARPRPPR